MHSDLPNNCMIDSPVNSCTTNLIDQEDNNSALTLTSDCIVAKLNILEDEENTNAEIAPNIKISTEHSDLSNNGIPLIFSS